MAGVTSDERTICPNCNPREFLEATKQAPGVRVSMGEIVVYEHCDDCGNLKPGKTEACPVCGVNLVRVHREFKK